MYEKRKNGSSRGLWLLVIGFVLGVLVTLGAVSVLGASNSSVVSEIQPDAALMATIFIQDATGTASVLMTGAVQATPDPNLDPLYMTATAIIQQATQQAGG